MSSRGRTKICRTGRRLFVTAAAVLGALFWRPVDACTLPNPEVQSVYPGGSLVTYPANGAIFVRGHRLLPDGLMATVDGSPAALLVVPELSVLDFDPTAFRTLALQLNPVPEPGQIVVVVGDPCEFQEAFPCTPLDIEYVAGDPDALSPVLDGALSFDLLRYVDLGDTCRGAGSEFWVTAEIASGELEPETTFRLEATHRDLEGPVRVGLIEEWGTFEGFMTLRAPEIGGAFPMDGWCVSMVLIDVARNASESIETCLPCMGAEASHIPFSQPPVWEPIPGGACDEPGETDGTTDEETEDSESTDDATDSADSLPAESDGGGQGCACGVSRNSSNGLLPLLAFVLVPLVRRRQHWAGPT